MNFQRDQGKLKNSSVFLLLCAVTIGGRKKTKNGIKHRRWQEKYSNKNNSNSLRNMSQTYSQSVCSINIGVEKIQKVRPSHWFARLCSRECYVCSSNLSRQTRTSPSVIQTPFIATHMYMYLDIYRSVTVSIDTTPYLTHTPS